MLKMFEKIKALLSLARIEHALMLSLAVFVGYLLLGVFPSNPLTFYASLLVPFFVEIFAFTMNDLLDKKADMINKRKRPLVVGTIKEEEAQTIIIVTLALAITLSFLLPIKALIISYVFIILSFLYNIKLKDIALLGNAFIAFSMAIPFIFSMFVVEAYNKNIYPLSFSIFLGGLAREIIKDIEDIEGDKKARGSNTLPIMLGEKNSAIIASLLLLGFVISISYVFLKIKDSISSLILFTFSILILLYSTYILLKNPKLNARKSRKLLLYSFGIGLISLLI